MVTHEKCVVARTHYSNEQVVFVDGNTGKTAIGYGEAQIIGAHEASSFVIFFRVGHCDSEKLSGRHIAG